jgi:hypothetical protein
VGLGQEALAPIGLPPGEGVDGQVQHLIVGEQDEMAVGLQFRLDGSEQMRGERAGDLFQGHDIAPILLRVLLRPAERPGRPALDVLAVLPDEAVELRLGHGLNLDLELAPRGDDETVELVRGREVLHGQRVGGQLLRKLGERARVHGVLVHELGLVLGVAPEERFDLRQVFGLGARELRGEALDPLGPLRAGGSPLLGAQDFLQGEHLLLLRLDRPGGPARLGVLQLRARRG